jgi:hypothetical protein
MTTIEDFIKRVLAMFSWKPSVCHVKKQATDARNNAVHALRNASASLSEAHTKRHEAEKLGIEIELLKAQADVRAAQEEFEQAKNGYQDSLSAYAVAESLVKQASHDLKDSESVKDSAYGNLEHARQVLEALKKRK